MVHCIACMAVVGLTGVPKICAYLDPGTGSFIFQMLIAGALGGLLALKLFWHSIKTFFAKLFSKGEKQQEDEQ